MGNTITDMSEEQLWTTGDIAARLTITSERARQLTHRPDFPPPVQTVRHIRAWRMADIEAWITRHRPKQAEQREPQ
ncbi:DNA-binding protein [Frankia sp. Cas4]|uniref:helix-turn-helix transcriptional regulator n=1 Tax=Frankia sp. Cas4 TaxID=3073927 RepID=UPI002AD33584|nr:DNA-binding protein [Frankia sp. Cas4]